MKNGVMPTMIYYGIKGMPRTVFTIFCAAAFDDSLTDGDQYLSIVLTGNIYKQLYKEIGSKAGC